MINANLISLGFSDKEAQVYIALFRYGASPASVLAKRLCFKRVTVYSVLESLCARALISFYVENGCRRYRAHNPEGLLDIFEDERASLDYRLKISRECVSYFKNLLSKIDSRTTPSLIDEFVKASRWTLIIGREVNNELLKLLSSELTGLNAGEINLFSTKPHCLKFKQDCSSLSFKFRLTEFRLPICMVILDEQMYRVYRDKDKLLRYTLVADLDLIESLKAIV